MTQYLKNLIVRDPISGRIFAVARATRPTAAVLTLRRLDREPREQSHIYRPLAEVQGWEVLEPRARAQAELHASCKGLLDACDGLLDVPPALHPHVERIASLVRI